MNNKIQIKRGGIIAIREWDAEKKDFVENIIEPDEFPYYIYSPAVLEKGITLRDIFLLISKNIVLFSNITACSFVDEMLAEALKIPVRNPNKDGMSALCIKRKAFIDKYNNESNLTIFYDFYGIGVKDEYSIEFSPINELTLYNIIASDKLVIEEDGQEVLSVKMPLTLCDIIRSVVDELSILGPPEIKAFAVETLQNEASGISAEITKTYTTEEMEKKLREVIDENKIPCKLCGEDARSPQFDKPEDICENCYKKIREN